MAPKAWYYQIPQALFNPDEDNSAVAKYGLLTCNCTTLVEALLPGSVSAQKVSNSAVRVLRIFLRCIFGKNRVDFPRDLHLTPQGEQLKEVQWFTSEKKEETLKQVKDAKKRRAFLKADLDKLKELIKNSKKVNVMIGCIRKAGVLSFLRPYNQHTVFIFEYDGEFYSLGADGFEPTWIPKKKTYDDRHFSLWTHMTSAFEPKGKMKMLSPDPFLDDATDLTVQIYLHEMPDALKDNLSKLVGLEEERQRGAEAKKEA